MIVCFLRHGEDMSDIYNEVGGWSDRGLTSRGIKTAFKLAEKLDKLSGKYGKFELLLSSPFARAKQTADVISRELSIRLEEDLYLKERNTYGLMSGMSKDVIRNEYPEIYEIFKKAGNMPGSERYEDFVLRIKKLLERLLLLHNKSIVCVTHGHLITVLIKEVLGGSMWRVSDGGGLVIKLEKEKIKLLEKWGMNKYSRKFWK